MTSPDTGSDPVATDSTSDLESDAVASSTPGDTPEEETKRKFREALEHKRGRQGEDHLGGQSKAGNQAHGPVDAKRTFRRKTGG